ncbi:8-oxo-dGTP pyrophosphatase MutT (NUDIX family) [Bradyrhizobium sp. USDA 4470]
MGKRLDEIRRRFEPLLRHVFHAYFLVVRGMTLGVRAVVLDADNKVFLVKHSYVAGWYLPGGGVDFGETMEQAMRRELKEEGDIDVTGEAVLHGIFLNSHISPPRPRRGLRGQAFPAGPAACAEPRDHRMRLLRPRCAAGGHDAGHAAAHRGSARRQAGDGDVAVRGPSTLAGIGDRSREVSRLPRFGLST